MIDFTKMSVKEKTRYLKEIDGKVMAFLAQPRSYLDIITHIFGTKNGNDIKYRVIIAETLTTLQEKGMVRNEFISFEFGENNKISIISVFWKVKPVEIPEEGIALLCRE